ncbi:hypothetical protein GCM10025859_55100 [Alicyclobacillus fastidiosus]|nr:hypothetical protein GCM10025859_55100 [Alicyclobacillus fastidiosus]
MNPVVGLDIAKGESKGQVFLDRGLPHGGSFNVIHTQEGFEEFLEVLRTVEATAEVRPVIIFESTGHYHTPVMEFLEENNYV